MTTKDALDKILNDAYNNDANDIHFILTKDNVSIKYRINSKLIFKTNISLSLYNRLIRYIKFKCSLDPSITNKPLDGSLTYKISNETINIRLSTVPVISGNSMVLRIIYNNKSDDNEINSINKEEIEKLYRHLCENTGIYIFTGPTGSGKTTSMYYLLNKYVKKMSKKVITIENPIEITNDNFTQIQVDENNNLDYNTGLKVALRQDPDIIMIGEIRDEKTARNVFRAGLTGHSVLTTMHTKNKLGVIERFIDFGFHKSEISSVIEGICNQRLMKFNNEMKSIYDISIGSNIVKMTKTMNEETDIYDQIKKYKKN